MAATEEVDIVRGIRFFRSIGRNDIANNLQASLDDARAQKQKDIEETATAAGIKKDSPVIGELKKRAGEISVGTGSALSTEPAIKNVLDKTIEAQKSGTLGNPVVQSALLSGAQNPSGPLVNQGINESQAAANLLESQNKSLTELRNKFETQTFGGTGLSLADALKNPQGDIGVLNAALGEQGQRAFEQALRPLIQNKLAGQGLFEGGAQIEQQAKGFGEVERARQAGVLQAALGARSQLQGLQRSDVISGIEQSQANLNSIFGLQRAGITMQFNQMLEDKRNQLSKELFEMSGRGGGADFLNYAQAGLGIGSALFGNPTGGLFGAAKSIFT